MLKLYYGRITGVKLIKYIGIRIFNVRGIFEYICPAKGQIFLISFERYGGFIEDADSVGARPHLMPPF